MYLTSLGSNLIGNLFVVFNKFDKLGLYAGTEVGIYVGIFVVGYVGYVGRHLSRGRYSSYEINK